VVDYHIDDGRGDSHFSAWLLAVAVATGLAWSQPVMAEDAAADPGLTELSIEELMNIKVTSVAKTPQKLSESAAAIFVLTQEDIRRSGMTSIPELLRMAPGLDVAQFDANKWAVSSRGFNDLFANKLLVLIDGRTVYTPLFSGVFWDAQDTLLEDIERIEVIRGPGGTLWGANAVNGVINIITKQARDTQGGLVTLATGNLEHNQEGLRYGGKLGESGYFRAYAKHFSRDNFVDATGVDAVDKWDQQRGGFRIDYDPQDKDTLTMQGESYSGNSGQTVTEPRLTSPYARTFSDVTHVSGSYLRTNWRHGLDGGADLSLQFYYDHTSRDPAALRELRDTYDLDFQHRFPWAGRHGLVWGVGYRQTKDETSSTRTLTWFNPANKTLKLLSALVQDESVWMEDRMHFIVGSKVEKNDYTGFEFQPNARLLWKTGADGALWAAVSRAVHTPSRGEIGVNVAASAFPSGLASPAPPVTVVTILGNPNLKSESLIAYEAGWRDKVRQNLSVDATVFYNDYKNIITHEMGAPYPDDPLQPTYLIVPLVVDNKAHGQVYGAEVAANWQATDLWRLSGSFGVLRMHLVTDPDSNDATVPQVSGNSPRQQWQLHSYLNLRRNVSLDTAIYYVSGLTGQTIPAYTRLDLRLGWQPRQDVELSLAVQNLTDDSHPEFSAGSGELSSEVPRGIYGKITWRF
jgi:iron complex outermembrane receptor protein